MRSLLSLDLPDNMDFAKFRAFLLQTHLPSQTHTTFHNILTMSYYSCYHLQDFKGPGQLCLQV